MASGVTSNANQVASQILASGVGAAGRGEAIERAFAKKAADSIAGAAPRGDGDDGGHYADSIQARDNEVVTDKDYWARLEFGFIGADSIGRVYSQPPQPHIRPVVESLEEPFTAAVAAEVLRGG